MKDMNITRCDGCGKHCPIKSLGCGYGKRHYGYLSAVKKTADIKKEKIGKWEGFVKMEGLVWRMICTSRSIKDALQEKHITEEELNAVLTDDDRRNLDSVLKKLEKVQNKIRDAV